MTKNDYHLSAIIAELESPLLNPFIEPLISNIKSLEIKNVKIDNILAALERGNIYLNSQKLDKDGQKKKIIFNQNEPSEVLELTPMADYPSSDSDTIQCAN
jgi:hypothetical protein